MQQSRITLVNHRPTVLAGNAEVANDDQDNYYSRGRERETSEKNEAIDDTIRKSENNEDDDDEHAFESSDEEYSFENSVAQSSSQRHTISIGAARPTNPPNRGYKRTAFKGGKNKSKTEQTGTKSPFRDEVVFGEHDGDDEADVVDGGDQTPKMKQLHQ